ncbi:hypothetical protein Terro_4171 [Terriglobus roseus DSM 18391]|uniref:Uncharacterized protein n=1 Tax=Terriglobus roseus (strain DSM 18391 / NRRL B-41598 / KBS 63) TaxID=926566 RepID=I3ZMA8_TERRK|nr:hypothetical protein [Terriglobus roseus]AFL90376.1 hypothetical protein Terro_4171 [Terriglobus roseus DSM 18391]
MNSTDKRLNEMNRLSDMGHFPAIVNAGATLNILLTITITWWLQPRHPQTYAPMVWISLVLFFNLLPVVMLRMSITPSTTYPRLSEMDFIRDQHKFSDWVYLAASANMTFWVLAAWAVFSVSHTAPRLIAMLVVAFVATFSPVLLRTARRPRRRA